MGTAKRHGRVNATSGALKFSPRKWANRRRRKEWLRLEEQWEGVGGKSFSLMRNSLG